jgi:Sarcosine oxidase delta subunit
MAVNSSRCLTRSVAAIEWADYVFNTDNLAGVVREWWMHTPSSYWFLAERHTVSDEILHTFDPKELFSTRVEFSAIAKEIAG